MEKVKFKEIAKSEPCPCGSSKRYRACCMMRKDEELPERLNTSEDYLRYFIKKRLNENKIQECLHPNKDECRGKIKNAHTLQNNRILNRLAENNHVIVIEAQGGYKGIQVDLNPLSKNKATTFTGFCDHHDTVIFRPIEVNEYNGSDEHNFLFAYRAFCQELHKKKESLAAQQDMFKMRPSLLKVPMFVQNYRYQKLSLDDLLKHKIIFDQALTTNDFGVLQTVVRELPQEYRLAATATFSMVYDLNGKQILDVYSMADERLPSCFLTVFPAPNKTYILYSWLREDEDIFGEVGRQLLALTDDQLKTCLNNLLPLYTENIIFHPQLWNSFSTYRRREFIEKFSSDYSPIHQPIKADLFSTTSYNLFS